MAIGRDQTVLDIRPTPDLRLLLRAGIAHHRAQHWREAEGCYAHVLRRDPDHPDANHLLGVLALELGDLDTAGTLIARAISADGKQARFYTNLGRVYYARRDLDLAEASWEQALALNPRDAHAWSNLGHVHTTRGALAEAERCYRRALAIEPDSQERRAVLAAAVSRRGGDNGLHGLLSGLGSDSTESGAA